jgi:hypothetical protein
MERAEVMGEQLQLQVRHQVRRELRELKVRQDCQEQKVKRVQAARQVPTVRPVLMDYQVPMEHKARKVLKVSRGYLECKVQQE